MSAAAHLELAREARRRSDEVGVLAEVARVLEFGDDDPETAFQARACAGRLYLQRGEPAKARPWFVEAHEVARASGCRYREGMAAHDLFVCDRDAGDRPGAHRWAERALVQYGRSRRCSALIADLSVMRDDPALWAPHFLMYATESTPVEDRIPALANLAESAAARGNRDYARSYAGRLIEAVHETEYRAGVPLALLSAAGALGIVGYFGDAERVAAEAARRAGEAGEEFVREKAEHARDNYARGRAPS